MGDLMKQQEWAQINDKLQAAKAGTRREKSLNRQTRPLLSMQRVTQQIYGSSSASDLFADYNHG
jgi:hypothetical protein